MLTSTTAAPLDDPTHHRHHHAGRAIRPLVTAALCVGLMALAPTAAEAKTFTDVDASGDMVELTEETLVPAPDHAHYDVTRTTLKHGAHRVKVRLELAELEQQGYSGMEISMVTNEHVRRNLSLSAYPGHWRGQVVMHDARWREIRCAVRRSIDYEADVVEVSFPRRCISRPSWIRFGVATFTGSTDEFEQFHMDDALRDRPLREEDEDFAKSPRVHRDT